MYIHGTRRCAGSASRGAAQAAKAAPRNPRRVTIDTSFMVFPPRLSGQFGWVQRWPQTRMTRGTENGIFRPYQWTFKPNCSVRIGAVRTRISPTRGASGLREFWLIKPIPFGFPNQGWLNALKASARNCSLTDSVIRKFLDMEKSRFRSDGAFRILGPALPQ